MDRPKDVVKSKSSNSAINTKSEARKNKTTMSNAELQQLMQKRSLYVEKVSTNSQVPIQQKVPKTPIIPRPGKKKFLASVLTILSQSTAATQFPESEGIDNRRCEKVKYKCRRRPSDVIPTLTEVSVQSTALKKPKFRSKILNEHRSDSEQFVVLQSKKDIINTPSNNSSCIREPEVIKWSDFLPPLVKRTDTGQEMDKMNNATEGIAKEIYEGLQMSDKKHITFVPDEIPQRNEKGLYNFFVDLLETTFSLYNVKAEPPIPSHNSSKVTLEINEVVAKKLRIPKSDETLKVYQDTQKPRNCCCVDNIFSIPTDTKPCKTKSEPPRDFNKTFPKTRSDNISARSKNPKKELLNILKTELSVDIANFQEPRNIYEALKLMAHNKRKCQKSIHFTRAKLNDENDPECVFKPQNIISFRSKSPKKPKYRPESEVLRSIRRLNDSRFIKRRRKVPIADVSTHSLEVTGFDYEPVPIKPLVQAKEVLMTYHSTPNQSEKDFNFNEALITYSPSGTSSFKNLL